MVIKKYNRTINRKIYITRLIKGGITMAVLAKPINTLFVVKAEKAEDFFNRKRDTGKRNAILEKANRFNNMRKKS